MACQARFVGHPVLESGAETGNAERFRSRHSIPADARILTVMPGSRQTEVSRLLPILEATIRLLPEPVVPVVPLAGPVEAVVRQRTASWPIRPILVADTEGKHDAFAASDAALTKSGTSTLELALANVPMLVTYRINPVSHQIAKRLIKIKVRLDPQSAAGSARGAGTAAIRQPAGPSGRRTSPPADGSGRRRGAASGVRGGFDDAAAAFGHAVGECGRSRAVDVVQPELSKPGLSQPEPAQRGLSKPGPS